MSFYVVYNADTELFLKIIHDEAKWVEEYMDAVWFANEEDAKSVIDTLIGSYPSNKMLSITDQIRTSYLVLVERYDNIEWNYDEQHVLFFDDAIMVNDL